MKRITLFLIGALVGLAILIVIAPFLLVGALLALLAAWRRPAMVERVTTHRRLAPVPATVRATPMRFASSLVAVSMFFTGASFAIAKPAPSAGSPDPSTAPIAPASVATATPTASPSARLTPPPTPPPTPTPAPTPVFGREPTGPIQIGQVVNVVDGDTIDVMVDGTKVRVRYIGMDTPETHSGLEWLGPEASAANSQLVMAREVVLEKDVSETDQYGRALRYVWLHDGATWTLVNLELIREGFATIMRYPPDVKYIDPIFVPAEDAAKAAGIGRWGAQPTPVATPRPATPVPFVPPPPKATPAPAQCHPSYVGACLQMGKGDYDCLGGGGDGPNYIAGPFRVVGPDEFRLDRDGNGIACEG
jgi:micrococcal nuclease